MQIKSPVLFFLLCSLGLFPLVVESKHTIENVIVIGWDGTQRDRLESLLHAGKLPNFKALIDHGSFLATEIREGKTETKPGWSQIFTGYNTDSLHVIDNEHYEPIPKGYTLFERLRKKFGKDGIRILFIAGKGNNLDARGPHLVCINCKSRFPENFKKTFWWDESHKGIPTMDGKPMKMVRRKGEPYFYAREAIDTFKVGLDEGEAVLPEALKALDTVKGKKFFAFFHFEEPDEQGHLYNEASPQYSAAIERADGFLGKIQAKLKEMQIEKSTTIFVITDHGQDHNRMSHHFAPNTWLASSQKILRMDPTADRRDFTPTLLDFYGFDLKSIQPKLMGKSLLQQ